MTPEDRELDRVIFDHPDVTLYRLAKAEYANLSGAGSALYPGRWNRFGQEAIYTSTDIGTPVLERLVHTPKGKIPTNLAMMQITLKQSLKFLPGSQLESSMRESLLVFKSLAKAKAEFDQGFAGHEPLLGIAVPSVIVPAWNVVLYPEHPLFWERISLKAIEEFQFDPRLFPDTAAVGR